MAVVNITRVHVIMFEESKQSKTAGDKLLLELFDDNSCSMIDDIKQLAAKTCGINDIGDTPATDLIAVETPHETSHHIGGDLYLWNFAVVLPRKVGKKKAEMFWSAWKDYLTKGKDAYAKNNAECKLLLDKSYKETEHEAVLV